MPETDPQTIRANLSIDSGLAAFDKLNALKPRWIFEKITQGVALVPDITIKKIGEAALTAPCDPFAKSFDDAVRNDLDAIREAASEPDTLVVVNATSPDRAEYTYDRQGDRFIPYKP